MATGRPAGVPSRVPRGHAPEGAAQRPRTRRAHPVWFRLLNRERGRGQALVELALVTPILLMLLLAAIDLGRLFYAEIAVAGSAREGAMVAANAPAGFSAGSACNATTNPIVCAAKKVGAGGMVSIGPADVSMTCSPDCTQTYGTTVTVTVTGTSRSSRRFSGHSRAARMWPSAGRRLPMSS